MNQMGNNQDFCNSVYVDKWYRVMASEQAGAVSEIMKFTKHAIRILCWSHELYLIL